VASSARKTSIVKAAEEPASIADTLQTWRTEIVAELGTAETELAEAQIECRRAAAAAVQPELARDEARRAFDLLGDALPASALAERLGWLDQAAHEAARTAGRFAAAATNAETRVTDLREAIRQADFLIERLIAAEDEPVATAA
jgi:hypothetical protein